MAAALPWLMPQFTDANGNPLPGGKVWVYQAGSSTPKTSYTDSTGSVPNPNPYILDSAGRGDIWLLPGSYKIVLMNKNDEIIWTKDKVKPADGGGGGIIDEDYVFDVFSLRFNEQFTSTGLMDTLEKIIKPGYAVPTISLSGSGSGTIREKGVSVTSVNLSAVIVKKSYDISAVRFYRGATLLDTQTSGGAIPSGGTNNYTYSTAFSDNTSFTAQVDDTAGDLGGPSTVTSNTVSFTFVYPYFYGPEWQGVPSPWYSVLTKDVIVSTATLTRSFTVNGTQKMEFAYPQSYGDLTEILDVSNFNTLPDWTKTTKVYSALDGASVNYNHYKFNNIAVAGTYQFTFKR